MKKLIHRLAAAALALCAALSPSESSASPGAACLLQRHDGFVPASDPEGMLLPPNAKGVLYFRGKLIFGEIEPSYSPPLKEKDFTFRDETIDTTLPVKLRPLKLDYGATLTRIEPVGGFTPGHIYHVERATTFRPDPEAPVGRQSLRVRIGNEPLSPSLLSSVALTLEGAIQNKLLPIGPFRDSVVVQQQMLNFELPAPLQPYRNSLLYFVASKSSDEPHYTPLAYRPDPCAEPGVGRSQVAVGKELIYSACPPLNNSRDDHTPERSFELTGQVGFLQMEDTVRTTAPILINFAPMTHSQCSLTPHLKSIADRDAEFETQLCALHVPFPFFDNSEALEFAKFIFPYLQDSRATVRRCAINAIGSTSMVVSWGSQDRRAYYSDTIIPMLGTMAGDDVDLETRLAAVAQLRNFAERNDPNYDFAPAIEGLKKATNASDPKLAAQAAELLPTLKPVTTVPCYSPGTLCDNKNGTSAPCTCVRKVFSTKAELSIPSR